MATGSRTICVFMGLVALALSGAAQAAAKPNIFGIWMGAGNADPRYRQTPLTPTPQLTAWGKAESDRWNTHETPGQCDPWNPVTFMVPSTLFPIQIVDAGAQILMLHEVVVAPRRIYTDGRKHPSSDEINPSFLGHSIAHWEGDVLVVDTIGFNGKARPINGYPAPAVNSVMPTEPRYPGSDQMHVVERYRLVADDVLEGEFTVQDPKTYTTPSFSTKRYYRRHDEVEMQEYVCTENERIQDEGQTAR